MVFVILNKREFGVNIKMSIFVFIIGISISLISVFVALYWKSRIKHDARNVLKVIDSDNIGF